jgi:AraC-like DNA-binding protein
MLKAGEQPITEIAYAVGYNSVRTFDRCFLMSKGTTPREYRLKALEKKNKG